MGQKHTTTELVRLAQQRFTPSADGTWPQPFKNFTDDHTRPSASRAIKEAFVKGHVKVVPTNVGAGPTRDALLEVRLMHRFGLSGAFVIRPEIEDKKNKSADEINDEVHRQLGYGAGAAILHGGLLRPGDRIACSSGRSPYHAVHYLAEGVRSSLRNIELISMAGNLNPKHYAVLPNLRLDADFNTQELARWFDNEVTARYVGRHAVPGSGSNVEELRERNEALGGTVWQTPVDIAIFGVGILRPGHRLHTVADTKHRDFEAIQRPLVELCNLADRYSTAEYCPIADIANRLLFVQPHAQHLLPPSKKARIAKLIGDVNRRTLTVTEAQFDQIKGGILIAGTLQKGAAVRQILRRHSIRYICTDADLAAHLLDESYDVRSSAREGNVDVHTQTRVGTKRPLKRTRN